MHVRTHLFETKDEAWVQETGLNNYLFSIYFMYLQALTLVGPTRDNLVFSLSVLSLDNLQRMYEKKPLIVCI